MELYISIDRRNRMVCWTRPWLEGYWISRLGILATHFILLMKDFSELPDAELHRLIKAHTEKRCGNCAFWMLKAHCKREETRIVGMGEHACPKFEVKQWYKDLAAEYEAELVMRNI